MPKFRHIVRTQDFKLDWLDRLFVQAAEAEAAIKDRRARATYRLDEWQMFELFYQPSTRTRTSFAAAMMRMGGQVIWTENAREFSSAAKGETPKDSIRSLDYADLIVVRHHEEGTVALMADQDVVPIVNAGDGPGQHPSQALLDLWTIKKERGCLEDLTIALMGDLKYGRTIHSLVYLLAKYEPKKLYFISSPDLALPDDIIAYLSRHGVSYELIDDVRLVAGEIDILYQTRVQKEYFKIAADYFRVASRQIIDNSIMRLLSDRARVMHPLPRVDEIDQEVDSDPRAAYFRQTRNGLFIRMALIRYVLGFWD